MTKAILAVAAALILSSGVAHADSDDDAAFLKAVRGLGVTATSATDQAMINLGHMICQRRADGYSENWIIETVPPPLRDGSPLSRNDMRVLVHSAETAYCPQYIS